MKTSSVSIATTKSVPVVANVVARDDQAPRVGAFGALEGGSSPTSYVGSPPKESPGSVCRRVFQPAYRWNEPTTEISTTPSAPTVEEDTRPRKGNNQAHLFSLRFQFR